MQDKVQIDVGRDFSRYPIGRKRNDGRYSGEAFLHQCLIPALSRARSVEIVLDSAIGYGSSFLEEAFGGLVRTSDLPLTEIESKLHLISSDEMLKDEIREYMVDAAQVDLNSK